MLQVLFIELVLVFDCIEFPIELVDAFLDAIVHGVTDAQGDECADDFADVLEEFDHVVIYETCVVLSTKVEATIAPGVAARAAGSRSGIRSGAASTRGIRDCDRAITAAGEWTRERRLMHAVV